MVWYGIVRYGPVRCNVFGLWCNWLVGSCLIHLAALLRLCQAQSTKPKRWTYGRTWCWAAIPPLPFAVRKHIRVSTLIALLSAPYNGRSISNNVRAFLPTMDLATTITNHWLHTNCQLPPPLLLLLCVSVYRYIQQQDWQWVLTASSLPAILLFYVRVGFRVVGEWYPGSFACDTALSCPGRILRCGVIDIRVPLAATLLLDVRVDSISFSRFFSYLLLHSNCLNLYYFCLDESFSKISSAITILNLLLLFFIL